MSAYQLSLTHRASFILEGRASARIRVTAGEIWVTRVADPVDHILTAGDSVAHNGKGLTSVLALEPSSLEISNEPPEALLERHRRDPAAFREAVQRNAATLRRAQSDALFRALVRGVRRIALGRPRCSA